MADGNGAGGNQVFQVLPGDKLTINSFGAFGNGALPLDPSELDTLRFNGAGLVAANMLMRQVGADVLITFSGVANTSVTLTNVTVEQLENIAGTGNLQFNAEPAVTDSLDVWSAAQQDPAISTPNRVTFLNELANQVNGLDGSNDVINGQGGNDQLHGLGGDDILRGGAGNDLLDGGTGNDRMEGGAGNDVYIVDSAGDKVVENVTNADGGGWSDEVRSSVNFSLYQHVNIEVLRLTGTLDISGTGNSGHNFIYGNDGANGINGREGNDYIKGGGGNDGLSGDSGADTLVGGTGDDVIDGGTGRDIAVFSGNVADYVFTPNGSGFYIQDMNTADGDDGKDLITNVEVLRFQDGDVGVVLPIADSNAGTNHVLEGAANGTLVGITAHAGHTLDGTVVYSLSNNAGGRFAIDPVTGVVSVANGTGIDYESAHQYSIMVRATDPASGLYREESFQIAVDDVPDEDVSVIDLANFNNSVGLRILGATAGDHAGYSVSTAGDMNGDGLDDVIVATIGSGAGKAYVVFGRDGGGTIDLADLAPEDGFRITGVGNGTMLGRSVSDAGDINGDGFADIIIGAPSQDSPGYNAGQSYVVYGGHIGNVDLANLDPSRGFTISGGGDYDFTGYAVSKAGDINGDGLDDLVVTGRDGTRGEAYVIYGKGDGVGDIDLGALTPEQGFRVTGTSGYDTSGFSVSSVGDFNGDGLDDIAIGGQSARPDNRHYAGETYIIFGQHGGSGDIDLDNLTPDQGIRISGASEYDFSGYSVSGAGDINGDGFGDVFISAPATDEAKRAFVIYGRGTGGDIDLSNISNYDGFSIVHSGGAFDARAISIAGDINGDGLDDMLVSRSDADPAGRLDAGTTYVVYGTMDVPAEIDLATMTPAQGFQIFGAQTWDHFGYSVSGAGDVNGDGFADLAVGAFYPDPEGRNDAGETYIIYGGNFTQSVSNLGGPGDDTIASIEMNAVLIGGAGNDDITGTGQSIIYGGSGNDHITIDDFSGQQNRVDGGNGIDTLAADNFDNAFDLAGAWHGRISDIEIVDLTGTRSNILSLDATTIGALSGNNGTAFGANTLLVRGDAEDLINLTDQGWVQNGTIGNPYGQSGDFVVWQNGAVTALIEVGVAVSANNIELARFDETDGIVITGAAAQDNAGRGLSYIGDVNGDGIDDIAIGVLGSDIGASSAGATYVIYGREDGGLHDINLADFTAADGFRVTGAAAGALLGACIGSAGDINNDGIDDLIIGAPGADGSAGRSYVVYGAAGGLGDVDLATLTATQGFSISGVAANDLSGLSINSAGDVNGDGFDDVVIGAQSADAGGLYNAGQAYVVYGGSGLGNIDLATMTSDQGFRLSGPTDYDGIGRSVSSAGDINGDGIDDFVVAGTRGTHAKAFVVYGQEENSNDINLDDFTSAQGFTILGTPDFDSSGFVVARAGDVNGDGFDDIILGDSSARQPGRHYSGESYVIYGNDTGHTDIDLSNLQASQGFRITGATEYDFSGASVSSAGDINGDGFDDILIGAASANPSDRSDAGAAYLIFGKETPVDVDLRHLTTEEGFTIAGDAASDFAGGRVSAAGDLNHDGYDDLLVGVPGADANGNLNAGQAFVIYGRDFSNAPLIMADLLEDAPTSRHGAAEPVALYPGTPQIPQPEMDTA